MTGAVEELEKAAELCGRVSFGARDAEIAANLLEPIAGFLGAETASFRSLSSSGGMHRLDTVVTVEIPDSVNDAYVTRYCSLDPARRLLDRRLKRPLFPHQTRSGEWSNERTTPAMLHQYHEDFLRYRKEFLLPNHFYHHTGFCFQDAGEQTLLFDFHRRAKSLEFGKLELARAHLVATFLYAKSSHWRRMPGPAGELNGVLSEREREVAAAVALGLSNKEVAARFDLSVRTVENHLRSIFAKIKVRTRTRLVAKLHDSTTR
jgi:DNA-binding CsgD family transcriptional regulator